MDFIAKLTDKMGYLFAVLGAAAGWFLGSVNGLIYALLAFVVCDYITGILYACLTKTLSSEVGFRGLAKKMAIFMLVGLANLIDVYVVGQGAVLRSAVILFYIANEGVSLMENWGKLGLPLPEKLKQSLIQLQEKQKMENQKGEKK